MLSRITSKELSVILNVSDKTARNVIKDVKEEFKIKIVTLYHVKKYLKVPVAQSVS